MPVAQNNVPLSLNTAADAAPNAPFTSQGPVTGEHDRKREGATAFSVHANSFRLGGNEERQDRSLDL